MSDRRFAFLRQLFLQRPLLVAAISGICAALFASGYLSRREAQLMSIAEPMAVVVARADVAQGEMLDASKLAMMRVARQLLQPGSLQTLEAASGRIAMVPIQRGVQLTRAIARLPADAFGLTGLIPSGKRAVSIALGRAGAIAGLIKPNDIVDVIATFEGDASSAARMTSLPLIQDLQILAVDRRLAGSVEHIRTTGGERTLFGGALPSPVANDLLTITFAATPVEAQKLLFAEASGKLSLLLHPVGEERSQAQMAPTTIESIAEGVPGFVPMQRRFREYRGNR